MTNTNEQPTRDESVAALIKAVYNRELAVSEPEFNALTVAILHALGRINCPSPSEFDELIETTRHPWVRTINRLLGEIANDTFPFPFRFDLIDGEDVLCVLPGQVIDHLESVWEKLPIKKDRALKQNMLTAGALLVDGDGKAQEFERVGHNKRSRAAQRCAHMVAIKLAVLRGYGLDLSPAVESVSIAA